MNTFGALFIVVPEEPYQWKNVIKLKKFIKASKKLWLKSSKSDKICDPVLHVSSSDGAALSFFTNRMG